MAPHILHRVIHGTPNPEPWQKALLSFKPAVLHGYRRHRVWGADYPGIVPVTNTTTSTDKNEKENTKPESNEANSSVLGTLVSGLTDGDIHRLDAFEGSDYVKTPVKVRVLRESVSVGGRQEGSVAKRPDGHLRDVLDAAKTEIADQGEEVEAVTYVWVAGVEALESAEWDFESFKRDKLAWWVKTDKSEW